MAPDTYADKHIVILGLARQGMALARYFLQRGARVTVSDLATADQLAAPLADLAGIEPESVSSRMRLVLGGHPPSLLDDCDLLCISGGVPPQIPLVQAARRQGIPLSNDTLITLENSPSPAIGITGSSGKTTTTTLVGLMLATSGLAVPDGESHWAQRRSLAPHVWVGGNIGLPLVDRLDQVVAGDWIVLELSSFQLELFDDSVGGSSISPHIAVVLNITPNHLDRHPSMAHYAASKANIVRWQATGDAAVLGAADAITGHWLRQGRVEIEAGPGQEARVFPLHARLLGFGVGQATCDGCWLDGGQIVLCEAGSRQPVVSAGEVKLRGRHNVLNAMAACATAHAAGVTREAMAEVVRTFAGVEHRLELVRDLKGVHWYNDSIATAPERAVAALRSFDEPIVLLAGGRDKKLPWDEFARLVNERARVLIVFGEAAGLIADAVAGQPGDHPVHVVRCVDLPQAVARAAELVKPGDVVLLSPGGTSFDAYKDFIARGEHFRALVKAL